MAGGGLGARAGRRGRLLRDARGAEWRAGADQHITAEHNAAFEQALADAGVDQELVSYEGAPHSFFDRKQEEFADASEDAWKRVLDFIERHR